MITIFFQIYQRNLIAKGEWCWNKYIFIGKKMNLDINTLNINKITLSGS